MVVKVGDTGHPKGIEVMTCYPDWAEKKERLFEEIKDPLRTATYEKNVLKDQDYIV